VKKAKLLPPLPQDHGAIGHMIVLFLLPVNGKRQKVQQRGKNTNEVKKKNNVLIYFKNWRSLSF
jgi:hypothetical protein